MFDRAVQSGVDLFLRKTMPRTIRSNGGLLGRTDLRDEMAVQMEGEFSITKNFVKFYMPFEPTDDDVNAFVQSAVSTASEKPTMYYTEQGLRFIDFTVAPGKDVGTEKACFRTLQTIADRISSAKVEGRTRNEFNFRLCPDSPIASDIPGSNNMIDACITSGDTKATILTATGIAVVFEFKTDAEKEIEASRSFIQTLCCAQRPKILLEQHASRVGQRSNHERRCSSNVHFWGTSHYFLLSIVSWLILK